MGEATVLVVDDDDGFRAYVRAALHDTPIRVLEASDGVEAIDMAMRERPDVILLDWRMPGQSGIATCRTLRSQDDFHDVPIAMITGLDDDRDRTLARQAGADAFLVKEPDPDALVGQVEKLLARRAAG